MNSKIFHNLLTVAIAIVWFINGLFCKLLNFVPRHQLIVSRILSEEYASELTKLIGVLEICMAIWIISAIKPRLSALAQIAIVTTMNMIEFFLVPELLLFGKLNAFFALVFILVIFYNEFVLRIRVAYQHS